MWFYQDMEEEPQTPADPNKPTTSRQLQTTVSRAQPAPAPVLKKKLFLTDGWEYPLTGICIYIFRINTTKQLPEEGFQKVIRSEKTENTNILHDFSIGSLLWCDRRRKNWVSNSCGTHNSSCFHGSVSISQS